MSEYEDRLESLRDRVTQASDVLGQRAAEQWNDRSRRRRVLDVLAYGALVIERTDPFLASARACQLIEESLQAMISNADGFVAGVHGDGWIEQVLDQLPALSAAPNADLARSAKDAAAFFQRSAQSRLAALNRDAATLQSELEAIRAEGERQAAEAAERTSSIEQDFAGRLTRIEEQARSEQNAMVELRTRQGAEFERAEEERRAAERQRVEKTETALQVALSEASHELAAQVGEIQRMAEESAQLVGAIGLAGTAERYGEEVDRQRKAALLWEIATVLIALAAIGPVLFALHERNPETEHFVGKVAVSLIFGGVAGYTGAQARHHRTREKRARDFQLELTAFSPFIEPLTPEQRAKERIVMTRRTFGFASNVQVDETQIERAIEAGGQAEPVPGPLVPPA